MYGKPPDSSQDNLGILTAAQRASMIYQIIKLYVASKSKDKTTSPTSVKKD